MKKFHVVNYHITNRCNYHCTYCFGKFDGQKDPSLADATRIIRNIADCFTQNNIKDGRINFAGGEPTLYEHLDELIDYASSLGLSVSIVTNGSLLTPERIYSWQGKVSCIGISIDSNDDTTNITIGRCCKNKVVDLPHWAELAKVIHRCGIHLKINTVISRLNLCEDLLPLYQALKPEKIKLFQMHLIDGINNRAEPYRITDSEFEGFCEHLKSFASVIFAEPCGSMENSYLMVNPEGKFQLNNNGVYQTFGDLNTTPLLEILKTVPLDSEKFSSRYTKEELK